jgi:UDP-N-acetylmuramoyl-tripeptide--D-alanyl-D-alanine ligase
VIALTLGEIAAATGGRCSGHRRRRPGDLGRHRLARGRPGALFVAIAGDHHDGHDHAAPLRARAVGVSPREVDAQACSSATPSSPSATSPARPPPARRRGRAHGRATGSSGRRAPDLLAQLLPLVGPTVATQGNHNNEIGLPLTVLTADEDTGLLVLEMGMRGLGHLAYLTGIAVPDVALVLNVGTAHVGEVGSREDVARAKAELVEALRPDGLAVLNADDPAVRAMASLTSARVVMFGEGAGADVRATDVRLDDRACASFVLHRAGASAPVSLPLPGEHQVSNALAAAAVALELGATLPGVAAALGAVTGRSRWRMEVSQTEDGVTVVNDAYNANPESVRAALKALVAMGGRERRTWAVLGEMKELGPDAVAEHDAIGRLAVRLDVSRLVCVGDGARTMHLGAAQEGSWGQESVWLPDADAAVALLRRELRPGDVVLVKASRSIGLEGVAQALLAGPTGEDGPL